MDYNGSFFYIYGLDERGVTNRGCRERQRQEKNESHAWYQHPD